jgi:hypothetical protein
MSDFNYFSITNDGYVIGAGGPNPIHVEHLPVDGEFLPNDPLQYSDVLKFSKRSYMSLSDIKVAQGKEDAVDINNKCKYLALHGEFGIGGGGKQVITIKGGSEHITFTGVSHGNNIEIGNWSDQSTNFTSNVTLNLKSANGKPIKVSIGRAKDIKLAGDCKKNLLGSVLVTAWWWVMYLYTEIFGSKK